MFRRLIVKQTFVKPIFQTSSANFGSSKLKRDKKKETKKSALAMTKKKKEIRRAPSKKKVKLIDQDETKILVELVRATVPTLEYPKQTKEESEKNKKLWMAYDQRLMRERNSDQISVSLRKVLHLSAIKNLPTQRMKKFAEQADRRPYPTTRWIPTWTPPHRK